MESFVQGGPGAGDLQWGRPCDLLRTAIGCRGDDGFDQVAGTICRVKNYCSKPHVVASTAARRDGRAEAAMVRTELFGCKLRRRRPHHSCACSLPCQR